MMVPLLVLGAVSLLGQVVLLRELTVAFFGSELITILGLGLWLAGSGAGAMLGRRDQRPTARRLPAAFLTFGTVVPAAVVLARGIRLLCGAVPGAYLPFPVQLGAMAGVLLPAALLSGLMFQWTAKLAVAEGRTLAAAYAIECGGALLGGAGATLLLAHGAGNLLGGMLCGMAAAGAALILARRGNARAPGAAAACCLALLVWGSLAAEPLNRGLTAWNHPRLLTTRDTPYGRVTVTGEGGQIALFVNDALAYENQGTAAEEFVHPAALQCPDPRRILVLGGGLTGILEEIRQHRPDRLVYVEMNPALLELSASLSLGPEANPPGGVIESGGSTEIVKADPRRYLAQARDFDLILVGMPEPSSGLDNRYYTREFFAACSRSLAPGGVLAFRLQGAENVWTPALARRNAGIRRALGAVFSAVAVLPGAVNVFVASGSPLPAVDTVAARWFDRELKTDLVTPDYLRYLYTNDRFAEIDRRLADTFAPMNTDAHPACYRETMRLWLSRFFPSLAWEAPRAARGEDLVRTPWLWGAAAAWLCLALAARRRENLRRFLAMASAGAAGMVLQSVLILAYQTGSGALYQDLGALLCLFMLGMTLGAAGSARAAAAGRGREPWPQILLCGSGLAVALLAGGGLLDWMPLAAGVLMAVGATVGAIFAHLSLHPGVRAAALSPLRLTPILLGADMIGGSAGSLGAGLYLVPVWGLVGSALAACAIGLGALAAARSRSA